MIINYTFDNSTNPSDTNSWANAPAGDETLAQQAVAQVVQLYETLFTSNVTLNITFQWGALASNVGADNNAGGGGLIFSWSQLASLLQADENSPTQKLAFGSLIANGDPTGSNNFSMTVAEAEALGLPTSIVNSLYTEAYGNAPPGGTVEFNSTSSWTFNEFFNAAAHEVSEIMGRNAVVGVLYSGPGSPNGPENNQLLYSPLDLFRYTATGQFNPSFGTSTSNKVALFGYDNGQVLTPEDFNNYSGGDRGDWLVTANPGGDTFGAVDGNAGALSGIDLTVMNLLGWNLATLTVAQALNVYAIDPYAPVSAPTADYDAPPTLSAPGLSLVVADSSATVWQNFNQLQNVASEGAIASITFTDLLPLIAVTGSQLISDSAVFPLLQGQYGLSVGLSGSPVSFVLPAGVTYVELTGTGNATFTANSLNDLFQDSGQGTITINAGDTGNYTVDSTAGTTILDYSSVAGYLTVSIENSSVTKPGGGDTFTAMDFFTNVPTFDGGSGTNIFQSIGTGDYTFNGQGTNNTLDYSADSAGVTISLSNHTVAKNLIILASADQIESANAILLPEYKDSFSDIQTFIGNQNADNTIVFDGSAKQYLIVDHPNGSITVTDTVAERDGTVTLENIQNLQFTDQTITEQASTVSALAAAADNLAKIINSGHLITITVDLSSPATVNGSPTLQLNDNEVAYYTGGSGTNTLTFDYLPLPIDNDPDLQVTGLNLPGGASITGLSGAVTGDLGLTIAGKLAPATAAQEINGLYVTLYGLAATQAGISYWESVLHNFDPSVTAPNAATTAISVNDEIYLGQQMTASSPVVNGQTYFQTLYPTTISDMAFVQALYQNMANFAGTTAGDNYWLSLLQQAEAGNGNNIIAARESIAGQFVHDFLSNDLTVGATALGVSQSDYTALVNGQQALLGKAAVSQYYATETQASGGAIINYTTVTDPAFTAAHNVVAAITSASSTVAVAITGINNAIAHQELSLI